MCDLNITPSNQSRLRFMAFLMLVIILVGREIHHSQRTISPVPDGIVVAAEPKINPVVKAKTDLEVIDGLKHGDILIYVYGQESTWGTHDGCKQQGRFNGFGYGQNDTVWNCFDTFEEVARKVDRWFDIQLKIKSRNQALCYYNTGYPTDDCTYVHKLNALSMGGENHE